MRPELPQWQRRARDQIAAPEDAVFSVERDKQLGVPRKVFRTSKEQVAARPQRIMEQWNDLRLQRMFQINQQITAGD